MAAQHWVDSRILYQMQVQPAEDALQATQWRCTLILLRNYD
jgi:hypothetical protein